MFETPMPEIPKEFWDERTVDMYWEVSYVGHPYDNYRVNLMRKTEYIRPAYMRHWEEINPKKRWWNSEPELVKKSEEIAEELVKGKSVVESSLLSYKLDFTAEDVYDGALDVIEKLLIEEKTRKLLGTYPPKTLDVDPEEL